MAIESEQASTRRNAIAAKFGYSPDEVAADGVHYNGIKVLVDAYQRERKPSDRVEYTADSPFVLVHWANEEQARAAFEAAEEDFREHVGPELYADITALRSDLQATGNIRVTGPTRYDGNAYVTSDGTWHQFPPTAHPK